MNLLFKKKSEADQLLNEGHYAEAINILEKLSKEFPDNTDCLNDLGAAYHKLGKVSKAIEIWEKADRIQPLQSHILSNLSIGYGQLQQIEKATRYAEKATRLAPENALLWNNLADCYKLSRSIEDALATYKEAMKRAPQNATIHSNYLLTLNYSEKVDQAFIYQEHLKWDQSHGNKRALSSSFSKKTPNSHIRIGYVSPDLHNHPVAYFFTPLLIQHNKNRFDIFLYHTGSRQDKVTAFIKKHTKHWTHMPFPNPETLAKKIHNDRIDILVDLSGHTPGNALEAFAYRPAPIQVTWLGYPNTTGLKCIDYKISDTIADPVEESDESLHSEKIYRLKHGFLCFQARPDLPSISTLPAIKKDLITFGSFNNILKMGQKTIETWAEILHKMPSSRLLLKSKGLQDPSISQVIKAKFKQLGVSENRISLHNNNYSYRAHMNLYNEIDIALDPFPYNGTTTTCEALLMGVPVITLRGNRHAARVGASILHQVGLDPFIAETNSDYVQKALSLAQEKETLAQIRATMRTRLLNSYLFNPPHFANEIENAFNYFLKHASP